MSSVQKSIIHLPLEDIVVGLNVLSAVGTLGVISKISYQTEFKLDDREKNPVIVIDWVNGRQSTAALGFLDLVKVVKL